MWSSNPPGRDLLTVPVSFTGTASAFTGPTGPAYVLDDILADYGIAGAGAATDCYGATPDHDCYAHEHHRNAPGGPLGRDVRRGARGDAGSSRTWTLHVGGSFADVPASRAVLPVRREPLPQRGDRRLRHAAMYCPATPVTRGQMAVFLLKSEHGNAYTPPGCAGVFSDVACPSPFADWIEQLFQERVTGGCGGDAYCPDTPVTRAQMAVFLLKASRGSAYVPPACSGTVFLDVPCTGGAFDPWIEDLAARGITGGCGAGTYCPGNPEQPRPDGGSSSSRRSAPQRTRTRQRRRRVRDGRRRARSRPLHGLARGQKAAPRPMARGGATILRLY